MEYKLDLKYDEKIKMDHACSLYKDEKLYEALPILEELYKTHSSSPMLAATLANLHWDLDDITTAIKLFRIAVELGPESEKISRGLLHILWEQHDEINAAKEIQRFIDTGSASKEYLKIADEINEKRDYNIRINKIR